MQSLKASITRKKWELLRWIIKSMIQKREWPTLLKIFWQEMRDEYSEENHFSTLATIVDEIHEIIEEESHAPN